MAKVVAPATKGGKALGARRFKGFKRFRGFKGEGIALWAMSRKSAVMGFTFVSPVLHDEEPEPPSLGKGGAAGDGG